MCGKVFCKIAAQRMSGRIHIFGMKRINITGNVIQIFGLSRQITGHNFQISQNIFNAGRLRTSKRYHDIFPTALLVRIAENRIIQTTSRTIGPKQFPFPNQLRYIGLIAKIFTVNLLSNRSILLIPPIIAFKQSNAVQMESDTPMMRTSVNRARKHSTPADGGQWHRPNRRHHCLW